MNDEPECGYFEVVSWHGYVIHRTASFALAKQKAIVWFNAAHITCDGKVVWTKEGSGVDQAKP
jgi:hypothetical protein